MTLVQDVLPVLTHDLLRHRGTAHGFFTREGGVSSGLYASLNTGIGSKDDRALVLDNRARAMAALGVAPEKLATPYQVHSAETVVVDAVWEPGKGPKADALVTNRPGIAVGVGAADCGPVLFAEPEARVVGAAHAGWRGALAGILESAIAAMQRLGAKRERISAVLGPSISQANYEVGPDLITAFEREMPSNRRFFKPSDRPDHAMFDLTGYIVARLEAAGVKADALRLCTYGDPQRFYSYRRATHRGEADYGRLLSAIALIE